MHTVVKVLQPSHTLGNHLIGNLTSLGHFCCQFKPSHTLGNHLIGNVIGEI